MRLVAIVVEVIGIATVAAGIGLEMALRADWAYIIIGVGSTLVAGGGMIYAKFYRRDLTNS